METRENSKKFLETYNRLDHYMRSILKRGSGKDSHSFLLREMANRGNSVFQKNQQELLLFADLRNSMVHNPFMDEADPIAEPHDFIVNKYKKIVDSVMNPPRALETIAVPESKIYKIYPKDSVMDIMRVMSRSGYSHVPIMRDGRVLGVFSTDTIFDYLADGLGTMPINETMLIRDLIDYTKLPNHANDYFKFLPATANLTEVEEEFSDSPVPGKRTAVIFLTDNGKPTGALLGMITPWDLLENGVKNRGDTDEIPR